MGSKAISRGVSQFRNQELVKIAPYVIGLFGIPMFVEASITDFNTFGRLGPEIVLRVAFIPIGLLGVFSYRLELFRRRPAVPILISELYMVVCTLYIMSRSGVDWIRYFAGLEKLMVAPVILPLSWRQYGSILGSLSIVYFGYLVLESWPSLNITSTPSFSFFITDLAMSVFMFYFTNRTRMALYKKTIEQTEELKDRSRIIEAKVKELTETRVDLEMEKIKSIHLDNLNTLAAQVSHDIRSPLAALEMISQDLTDSSEERRGLVRSATRRIKDIANVLLEKNRTYKEPGRVSIHDYRPSVLETALERPELQVEFVPGLLESIVSEKRMQYRGRHGFELVLEFDRSDYGLFINVQARELKRVISNLVNNAVEASTGIPIVTVGLERSGNDLKISIKDKGSGIPASLLPHLGKKGATFNKIGGNGLGLYHAQEKVGEWGGSLGINSQEGNGTSIKLQIPLVAVPAWFVQKLVLRPSSCVIVVDDDSSIHQVWKERLRQLPSSELIVSRLVYLSQTLDLEKCLKQQHVPLRDLLVLCDYEFAGRTETGIDVLENLGLISKSLLVTSRFEEPQLLARSEAIGLGVVPKYMAGFIPIELQN